ncbi:predicted integral membrane protein [Zymobacter palmae]|uniref:Predicted integral membrane protein n=1 Tax=Zymobacter palmae TaxID=33074 RepID=A0A348HD17_9GAMM|nr:predicted integral membrane protein [Zymobacter palmae]
MQLGNRFAERLLATEDALVGVFQRADRFSGEPTSTQPFRIDAVRMSRVAIDHDKGRNVLSNDRAATTHGMRTNVTELMHGGQPTQDSMITNGDMPAQRGLVGHDAVIANNAVVCYVRVGHEQVVAADTRQRLILNRTSVHGNTFTERILITNLEIRFFTVIFQILAVLTDSGELEDTIARTDDRGTLDDDVGCNDTPRSDDDIRPNNTIRPDFDVIGDPRFRVDDSSRVDQAIFLSAQMMSASQASSSST